MKHLESEKKNDIKMKTEYIVNMISIYVEMKSVFTSVKPNSVLLQALGYFNHIFLNWKAFNKLMGVDIAVTYRGPRFCNRFVQNF